MRRWSEGFFLLDSLLTVFIVLSLCGLCFSIYRVMTRYDEGYESYQRRSDQRYEAIFRQLEECEACIADESD